MRQPEEGSTWCFFVGVEWEALWHPAGLPRLVEGGWGAGRGQEGVAVLSHRGLKWKCYLDII